MKTIIIKESNRAKIEEAISKAEGKARTRRIDYMDILIAIKEIEKKLNIPKKHMEGTSAWVDTWNQKYPNAYHGVPESTQFHVVYKNGSWKLIEVCRSITGRGTGEYSLNLSESTEEALIKKYRMF